MDFLREIKWFIQRGKRGWSDRDAWDVHHYLSEIIPQMLRQMRKYNSGCPSELYDETRTNDECHKWESILEEIAQGFEAGEYVHGTHYTKFVDQGDGTSKLETDTEALDNARKKMERGLELFAEYYLALWD